MKRVIFLLAVAAMVIAGCGGGGDEAFVATISTTSILAPTTAQAPSTTVAPGAITTTRRVTTTTVAAGPIEEVVATGTAAGGPWQLVVEPGGRAGLVCAELRGRFQFGGGVCNEASEQDFNGDDTLRYSIAGDGTFVIGVTRPAVAKVRVELRSAATIERATVAASFTTAARFVAVPLPAPSTIRSLTALDGGGRVLTTITVSP